MTRQNISRDKCYTAVVDAIGFLRSFKIGPFAIFDSMLAWVGIFVLAPFLSKIFLRFGLVIPRSSWLLLTLPIAILFHVAIGQMTPLTKMVLDPSGFFLAKAVVLIMLLVAILKIKRA